MFLFTSHMKVLSDILKLLTYEWKIIQHVNKTLTLKSELFLSVRNNIS